MSSLPLLFNTVLEVLCNKSRKEIKVTHTGKEDIKLSLFTDVMIIFVENPRESTKNYWN